MITCHKNNEKSVPRRCSAQFNAIRPLGVLHLAVRHRVHPVFSRRSHDDKPQVRQLFVRRSLEAYFSILLCAHLSVNALPVGRHRHKAIAPSGLVRIYRVISFHCLVDAFKLHLHFLSRPGNCERNGVESVIFRTVLRRNLIPSVRLSGQLAGILVGIRARIFPHPFKIPVYEVTARVEHFIAKRRLRQPRHPLVGNHRVFPPFPLTEHYLRTIQLMKETSC